MYRRTAAYDNRHPRATKLTMQLGRVRVPLADIRGLVVVGLPDKAIDDAWAPNSRCDAMPGIPAGSEVVLLRRGGEYYTDVPGRRPFPVQRA